MATFKSSLFFSTNTRLASHEAGGKQPCYIIIYCLSSFVPDSAERLLHRSCVNSDVKRVLIQLPRYTQKVLIPPRKDVPILTEEVDEFAFLFLLQPDTNDDGVLRVSLVDSDPLGLPCCLECHARLWSRGGRLLELH